LDVSDPAQVSEDWVLGSLQPTRALFAGNLAVQMGFCASKPSKDHEFIEERRTPVHQAPEAPGKVWDKAPIVPATETEE